MLGLLKPAHWAWMPALTPPEWHWVSKDPDLVLAVPLWEGGGNNVYDVVNREIHPITGGGWVMDERGLAQNFLTSTHGINLGSPTYLNFVDPVTVIYAGQVNVTQDTRHIAGFYESGGAFPGFAPAIRGGSDLLQFWDSTAWRNSAVVVTVGFQILGFTHTGSTVEFYKDGVNVASIAATAIASYTGQKTLFVQSDFTDSIRTTASGIYIFKRTVSDAQHFQISQDFNGPFRMRDDMRGTIVPAIAGLPWIRRRRR